MRPHQRNNPLKLPRPGVQTHNRLRQLPAIVNASQAHHLLTNTMDQGHIARLRSDGILFWVLSVGRSTCRKKFRV